MDYLIRYAEIGSEPHPEKSKLRNDILNSIKSQIQNPKSILETGRVFLETDDPNAIEKLKSIHGIVSFSPTVKCELPDLESEVMSFAKDILKGKRRFGVKVKRVGKHKFSSQEMAGELGARIKKLFPKTKIDLKKPEEMIFIEIRGNNCYIFNQIIPGLDRLVLAPSSSSLPYKFVADDMLGKLARRLRMMGFDVAYPKSSADSLLLRISREEDRLILTRDLGIAKVRNARVVLLKSIKLSEQIKEVFAHLRIKPDPKRMFTRCPVCNGRLKKIEKEKVKNRLPPVVYRIFNDFTTCTHCGKVYWKGTHYEKIVEDMPK